MIPFNKLHLTGKELHYIQEAIAVNHLSGNGSFTKRCHQYFQDRYGFAHCLLTTSCTDALEMAAILLDIQPGDEVLMPSYTFVSTANAFVLRGAIIRFVDSCPDHPGMDVGLLEPLINERTRAIVPVHYAGVACDMAGIMALADQYGLFVVEDAAQAIESYYIWPDGRRSPLGSMGHLAAFSFHETKNISSGEGGMLVVNDARFAHRAEIIWEKGTNRSAFWGGEVDKYGWVDMGSSFLPSELIVAFLFAQLESLEDIQATRMRHWNQYHDLLAPFEQQGHLRRPYIPAYSTHNAHMYYVLCSSLEARTALLAHLKEQGIGAVFHYISLHSSPYYAARHDGRVLPHTDRYTDTLIRLPLFYDLHDAEIDEVGAVMAAHWQ